MKILTIGTDYGTVFGFDKTKNQHMIYNGGDNWTAQNGAISKTADSVGTTTKVLDYINKPSYHMGTFGS